MSSSEGLQPAYASKRYAVMLHVETDAEPMEVAAAIAVALNYQHVGGICVAPAETFSWEDPVLPKDSLHV